MGLQNVQQRQESRQDYEWLTQQGAREIKIPYRANRAVVFNSDLFHETDDIAFKEGLTNRRINITLLYGHRHRS